MASSPSVSMSPSSNAEENFEPTQMEENTDDADTQEVDQNAATQVPFEETLDFGDTQIDTEAPTQVPDDFQETQIDTDAPTQVDFDTEEATQIIAEETVSEENDPGEMTQTDNVDPDAPTQLFDSTETMDEPTQVEDEMPTQVENIIDDSDAPTQIEGDGIDTEAPTQIEDANKRRSRSGSRSSAARSRSGSASSRSKSRSVSRSRSRSRSVGSRSRSGSPRSRSGSPRSRSGSPRSRKSRSGSPRSRAGSPKSRSSSRSVSRSRSRSKSKSRSRSKSKSKSRSRSRSRSSSSSSSRSKKSRSRSRSPGSDSEDDIGKAKKRAVKEAFGSDNEDKGGDDDSDVENAAKKKRKRIVNNDDDEDSQEEKAPEAGGQEDQDRPAAEAENNAALPADSSSDEGITDAPGGGGGVDMSGMSDFDMMMELKRAEKRRRRKKDIDLINDNDDAIAKMIADMRLAAREDRDLNGVRQPATKKISMLPVVMAQLKKADLQMAFVEANVLSVLTDWLAPMPDKSLPSIQIRKSILKLLYELRIDDHSRLKESGIGKAVMYLYKHPRELRENKELAGKIINQWARPIFNLSTDFKSITKEERQERDEMISHVKRRKEEQAPETEEVLRPGDPGWCYRARVPMPQSASYTKRPEWEGEAISSKKKGGKGAKKSKMDKYIKVAVAQKARLKTKRAVDISIEGRKMAL